MGVLPRSKFVLCQVKVQKPNLLFFVSVCKCVEAKNGQALQTSASSARAACAALTSTCAVQRVEKTAR